MLIPPESLAAGTLRAIAEEFVSREGGLSADIPRETEQVLRMLANGTAVLCFEQDDQGAGTCNILMREEWERRVIPPS